MSTAAGLDPDRIVLPKEVTDQDEKDASDRLKGLFGQFEQVGMQGSRGNEPEEWRLACLPTLAAARGFMTVWMHVAQALAL